VEGDSHPLRAPHGEVRTLSRVHTGYSRAIAAATKRVRSTLPAYHMPPLFCTPCLARAHLAARQRQAHDQPAPHTLAGILATPSCRSTWRSTGSASSTLA
jgi:hypothetical protein